MDKGYGKNGAMQCVTSVFQLMQEILQKVDESHLPPLSDRPFLTEMKRQSKQKEVSIHLK